MCALCSELAHLHQNDAKGGDYFRVAIQKARPISAGISLPPNSAILKSIIVRLVSYLERG
jgi:hypothetical protein